MKALTRFLILIGFLLRPWEAHADMPLTWTETLETSVGRLSIPMEMFLKPRSETQLDITLAAGLGSLQRRLPAMLTEVLVDECDERIAVEFSSAKPEGDFVRLTGRGQAILYSCNKQRDLDSRIKLVSAIADLEILISGFVRKGCINAKLEDVIIRPQGVVGDILNITGLTASITDDVREELATALNDEDSCIDLPEPLLAIETKLVSGGFRDFGNGKMGAVVKATANTSAKNIVELYVWLETEGLLDGDCDCED